MNPMHLSKTAEHYTPVEIVRAARQVLGGIDLDPASCAEANKIVGARKFYTKEDDGLSKDWAKDGHTIFVNPPGDRSGRLVKRFWEKAVYTWTNNKDVEIIWVGFNINQLQQLQNTDAPFSPLRFTLCVPSKRLKFGGPNPTHANYIVYLRSVYTTKLTFPGVFSEIGEVTNVN